MEKVAILTDSVSCLPRDLVDKFDIHIIPINIVIDGKVYRDGIDIAADEFYRILKQAGTPPTTTPASPGEYLAAYRDLAKDTSSILYIAVSSRFSNLAESARIAAESAREALPGVSISVLDSETAGGAQGFVVLAAAQAAAQGKTLAETIRAAQDMIPRVHVIAVVDTLDYLRRSGRVPKIAAWAGSLLKIKPVIQIYRNEVTPMGRPRTKQKAVAEMLAFAAQQVNKKPVHVNLMHAGVPEEAEALRRRIESEFNCIQLVVTEFTPVMGCHTGPGVLAIAYYAAD